jgi:hypothetical protein
VTKTITEILEKPKTDNAIKQFSAYRKRMTMKIEWEERGEKIIE